MQSLLRHLKAIEKQCQKAIRQHLGQVCNTPTLNLTFQRAKYRSLTPGLKLLLLACTGVIPLSLIASPANAATCGVGVITRISSPVFYIDTGVSPSPQGMYVGYTINNTSGSAYPDLWVKLENFTGTRLGLASTENGIVHVGPLAAGASRTVYFYVMSSGTGNTLTPLQTHTVSLYPTRPDLAASNICSDPFSLTVEETIKAVANKITTVVTGPTPPELGGIMTMTVTGDTGTIGAAGIFAITPASFIDWPANAYKLVGTQMSLSGGNTGTFNDILHKVVSNSQTTSYTLTYTFIATGSTVAPTTVSPISQLSSGTQIKHNDTGSFASLPPIPPTVNNVTISKSVNTSIMPTGGVATYTITIRNTGTIPVTLDDLVDQLPTSPGAVSYVTNSAKFNGSAIANPNIAASKLTFLGLFTVPAGGTSTLTYQAAIPNTIGTYSNSAVGHIGSTQIDTTTNTSDNVPAIATILVGQTDLSLTKTVDNGTPTVGNNITYAIAVTNNGPNPTSGVIVKDILPSQVSYVSDNSGGSYNSATGNWNVGSLNNGETKTLQITVKVNTATTFSNTTEVTASSLADPDSTPNNNIANEDDQASVAVTSTAPITVTLSGKIWDDADNSANNTFTNINTGSETGSNAGGLNAILLDSTGRVIATTAVLSDGTYIFSNITANQTSVTIRLSTTAGIVGQTAPVSSLPTGWVNTSPLEQTAFNIATANITNKDFGIEQPPNTSDVTVTSQTNPGGTTTVQVPALSGTDPEDGTLSTGKRFKIITLPTNGTLSYNGTAVTAGQVINNYDPPKLTIDPNDGAITVSFTYAAIDAAGQQDPTPATVMMPFVSPANVLLVKRITAINGDRTKNPNDNTALNTFVDDTTSTRQADDNSPNWQLNYLLGAIDAGLVLPGDEIEYTIYFLNAGSSNANTVRICDRLSANQDFKGSAYGASIDVQLQLGTSTVVDLTSASDAGDRTQLISAGGSVPANCYLKAANDNGTLVIDVTGNTGVPNLTTMPGSTAKGSPNDSYGFFRFVTKVKP
ncbi:DUF11 domain-containing protein [Nostoc sp. CHAB 5836]|uniref:DUF11 domain-containing protein n=1 Tax=Nostoc sp. CHAB 5836 TaxID=2780404 RepID=UPI001E365CD8|nr:DUF11 domain-containing protein [Nostoc sp. CHAB 5836]MCC5616139.1 DUF11 domain-containing protein [Nostoc sp. CHAB 5836]